jgi:alpha-glucosidase (family GH31 glycosyl hydrolase)
LSSFGVDLRENQYQIGIDNDYFVKNANGEVYLIKSISIQFAMVDFTNPNARNWIK